MKRLPINQEERLFLKAIETNAMVVLLMFKIYPMPLNADTLTFEMKWDSRKAKKMLADLSSDGFTELMKGQGYILNPDARRMVADFFGNLIALPLEAQALAPESQAQAQQVLEAASPEQLSQSTIKAVAENSSTRGARALEEVEESSLILRVKDSSPPSESAQSALTTENILAHTAILFGDPGVVTAGLDQDRIQPQYALGWVAQAYDQRRRPEYPRGLVAPAGLVYARLRDIEDPKPRESYYVAPEKYLPDEYLELLGLVEYACGSCGLTFEKHAELESHESLMFACEYFCGDRFHTMTEVEEHHKSHHNEKASSVTAVTLDKDDPGYRAWQGVLEQLKGEMPRASFETWVRDTEPVEFDGRVLTVGARNAYCRDWLESRQERTVERLLFGILNAKVSVRFIVAKVADND